MGKKVIKKKEPAKKSTAGTVSSKKANKVVVAKKAAPAKKSIAKSKPEPKKPVQAKKAVPAKVKPAPKKAVPKTIVSKPVPKKTIKVTTVSKPVVKKTIVAKPSSKVAPIKELAKKEVPKKTIPPSKPSVKTVVAKPIAVVKEVKKSIEPVEKTLPVLKGRPKKEKLVKEVIPKPEVKKRPVVVKQLAKPLGTARRPEIIVPKHTKPIEIDANDKMPLKKDLLAKCLDLQSLVIATAKNAMNEAQESANEEKDSNEDMSDSFRETMHATRDVYARQVQEGINALGLLNRIMIKPNETVKFGSVVITDFQNYFIAAGLGEVKLGDYVFVTVSTLTPLFQILSDKKKGDLFMFLDRKYRILDVF